MGGMQERRGKEEKFWSLDRFLSPCLMQGNPVLPGLGSGRGAGSRSSRWLFHFAWRGCWGGSRPWSVRCGSQSCCAPLPVIPCDGASSESVDAGNGTQRRRLPRRIGCGRKNDSSNTGGRRREDSGEGGYAHAVEAGRILEASSAPPMMACRRAAGAASH